MKANIQIDSIIAKSGETTYGFLDAGELQDGTIVKLPIAIINGIEDGPIIYIQAGSDGNELNGIAVIHNILNAVSPTELNGAIIAVPIANIFAFHFRQSLSIADDKKMNRCFPGKLNGTSSEMIAYKLFHSAVLKSQYCIDLHQNGVKPMVDSINVRVSRRHRLYKKCIELAKVFGIGYILDQKGPKGQLAQVAPDNNIPTIDPELGGCHGLDNISINKGVKGIYNVLKYYGLIKGEPEIPGKQIIVRDLLTIQNNHGGFIRYRANLYDILEHGEAIADICDVFGKTIETITAPKKGIFWSKNLYPMVFSGSIIGTIGTEISYI